MEVKIKVEKFLMKQAGFKVGKAALEFIGEGPLNGIHMVGFTICDDGVKAKYVMMPTARTNSFSAQKDKKEEENVRNFHFLRADSAKLNDLQTAILDVYDSLCEQEFRNTPRIKQEEVKV